MSRIIKGELERLKATVAAATPGPWITVDDGFHAGVGTKAAADKRSASGQKHAHADICGGDSYEGYFEGPDAIFIATFNPELVGRLLLLVEATEKFIRLHDGEDDDLGRGICDVGILRNALAALDAL